MKLITIILLTFSLLIQTPVIAFSDQNLSPVTRIDPSIPVEAQMLKMYWGNLVEHASEERRTPINNHFRGKRGTRRATDYSISLNGALGFFHLDYSKNFMSNPNLKRLASLATWSDFKEKRMAMFNGNGLNQEERDVFHLAFRKRSSGTFTVQGENLMPQIRDVLKKMKIFAYDIRFKKLKSTGKKVKHVVHIGFEGGELGNKMVYNTLKRYQNGPEIHFVSNTDEEKLKAYLKGLDPETTLFIVASKTFTGEETTNSINIAKSWLFDNIQKRKGLDESKILANHFAAISADSEEAAKFGIDSNKIFEFWDFNNERYSVWSPLSLPLMIAFGFKQFEQFLEGAHEMDKHFRSKPLLKNMPAIMALLGIWYNDFMGAKGHAILPYDSSLHRFTAHLPLNQQIDDSSANENELIPTDFIGFIRPLPSVEAPISGEQSTALVPVNTTSANPRDALMAHFLSHTRRLASINKPTNTLLIDRLTPKTFGALMALYEHREFVQEVIYTGDPSNKIRTNHRPIKPTKLEKIIDSGVLNGIQSRTIKPDLLDPSTEKLLRVYLIRQINTAA